jgi:conflict system STAND superfamily ATPase
VIAEPFVGLNPFSVDHQDYFFGRDQEAELLGANLRSSRLTLLYGPTGTGKTSLLTAGLIARLGRSARENLRRRGKPGFVPALFRTWQVDPLLGVADAVRDSTARIVSDPVAAALYAGSSTLTQVLDAWTESRFGDLLLILDQFELFFVYAENVQVHPFVDELSARVSDPFSNINVLISIREDWLPALDVFKGRMPGLFENYFRLKKLDLDAALAAIEGPVARYNKDHKASITIEKGLAEEVLKLSVPRRPAMSIVVPSRRDRLTRWLRRRSAPAPDDQPVGDALEAPALQIIMQRIWKEDIGGGSTMLRRSTLARLTERRDIIDEYVRNTINQLRPSEWRIVARLVERLVTPSGTKIAMRLGDLALIANRPVATLERLVAKLGPLLNDVAPPRGVKDRCFEISHDVLAPALSKWQVEYQERRRVWQVAAVFSLVLAFAVGFSAYYYTTNRRLTQAITEFRREREARQIAEERLKLLAQGASERTAEPKPGTSDASPKPTEALPSVGKPLGTLSRSSLWAAGGTLHLRFLDGPPPLRDRVRRVAEEWTKYANLTFAFDDAPNAELRVSFRQPGSWAFLGKTALEVPRNQPNINYGYIDRNSSDRDVSQYVLHELGHILGLVHEMNQPNASIPWNPAKVFATFSSAPYLWGRDEMETNLLGKYRQGDYPSKPFDPKSIMMWPIPKELTDGKFESGTNVTLSDGDKAYVAVLYPGR